MRPKGNKKRSQAFAWEREYWSAGFVVDRLPHESAEQSRSDVVMSSFPITRTGIVGAIAGSIHVAKELAIAFPTVGATSVTRIMRGARWTKIRTVKSLRDQLISPPGIPRPTWSPWRTISLS